MKVEKTTIVINNKVHDNFVRSLERKVRRSVTERKVFMATIVALCFLLLLLGFKVNAQANEIFELEQHIGSVEAKALNHEIAYQNIYGDSQIIAQEFNDTATMMQAITEVSIDLHDQNVELNNQVIELSNELDQYKMRSELYDKYSDYLYYKGQKNDLTLTQISSLEALCAQKGLSNDAVHLILSLVLTESHGEEDAVNKKSTAAGYGQFLSGTGRMVYTKLMGMKNYDHYTAATDGDTNLKMMVYYVSYLKQEHEGSVEGVLTEYAGKYDKAWMNKVDEQLKKHGLSINSIKL